MFGKRASELVVEDPECFQPPVDCLMPSTGVPLPASLSLIVKVLPWCIEVAWVASVSLVRDGPLAIVMVKHVNKIIQSNLQVRSLTTGKGSVDPYNVSSLDCHTNLVPHTWSVELLTVPPLGEWMWLHNLEVSTIHSDLAPAAIVKDEPILPLDLEKENVESMEEPSPSWE